MNTTQYNEIIRENPDIAFQEISRLLSELGEKNKRIENLYVCITEYVLTDKQTHLGLYCIRPNSLAWMESRTSRVLLFFSHKVTMHGSEKSNNLDNE